VVGRQGPLDQAVEVGKSHGLDNKSVDGPVLVNNHSAIGLLSLMLLPTDQLTGIITLIRHEDIQGTKIHTEDPGRRKLLLLVGTSGAG
jgi:hypothetical protein